MSKAVAGSIFSNYFTDVCGHHVALYLSTGRNVSIINGVYSPNITELSRGRSRYE